MWLAIITITLSALLLCRLLYNWWVIQRRLDRFVSRR